MAAEYRVCPIPIAHVPFLWSVVGPLIDKALIRDGSGRYIADDVLKLLIEAKAQLWVAWNGETRAIDAAIVTEIMHFPRLKDCRIWLIGGRNMRGWIKLARETIEDFARANGCTYLSGGMRKGWLRMGVGWRQSGVNIEKDLRDGR